MKSIKLYLLMTALIFPIYSSANDTVPNDRTITEVRAYDSYVVIRFTPSYVNNIGCSGSNKNDHAVIDFQLGPNPEIMYSAALAAFSAGKNVGFGLTSAVACYSWAGGVPVIYRVDVVD